MDFPHGVVQSVYRAARRRLCDVDKLVEVVLFVSSASQDESACSQTARLGFEALTGGFDMTATVEAVRFMNPAAANSMPDRMDQPSVTYVSLTGDGSNLFADDDGHRFLVLQCHGHVRVLQACKDECSARDFVTAGQYSLAAATMTYKSFEVWWNTLITALRTQLEPHNYDANAMGGETMSQDKRAAAVTRVLGVPYGGKADQSWFFQRPVRF